MLPSMKGGCDTKLSGRQSWPSRNFKSIIFKLIIQNSSLGTRCEIADRWMPQNLTNEKSTLVQVMVGAVMHQAMTWANFDQYLWRHQATMS